MPGGVIIILRPWKGNSKCAPHFILVSTTAYGKVINNIGETGSQKFNCGAHLEKCPP